MSAVRQYLWYVTGISITWLPLKDGRRKKESDYLKNKKLLMCVRV